ncbi:hypothetical protein IW147_005249 [Coemansia sp. RSA 720]|nr:hypothetical protein IW147_005249 [Coemansia sp. RSA 720]
MHDASKAGAHSPEHNDAAGTGVHSDDEFYDCKSNFSSTKASLDTAAGAARSSQNIEKSRAAAADDTDALQERSQISTPPQRFRSLTGASVSSDSSAGHGVHSSVAVRRSTSVKPSRLLPKFADGVDANRLVEQRARRAIKAMAEACTTGISARETGERSSLRGPTGRRLVGSSSFSEQQAARAGPRKIPLHQSSSYNRVSGSVPPESEDQDGTITDFERTIPSSTTPEPDSRARSLTGDNAAIARSASLEARMDAKTRERLQRWVLSFGTVHFDVDQGPTLQLLYPHVGFSSSERAAVCFSSMPDSTIYELCDSVYTFNFRVDPVRLGLAKDNIFLHGYVFFRQKRDPLMRRGGFQRSVVIISHLPYNGLFARLAHILGPLYFDLGTAILEAAAHNVASWPQPEAGQALELPFLGSALSVELPTRYASQLLETSRFPLERFDPGDHILAGVTYDGLFRSFRDTLDDLWACWELMILGEPLVVLADNPSLCSEAIVGLVDIIFPIAYCGDWRPYFTIQDPDLRAIVSKTHVPPNTVVGVSNPFFSEALGHWPHKLYLGTSERMSQMLGVTARRAGTAGSEGSGSGSTAAGPTGRGIRQGLQSRRRCAVSRDRPFAEQLLCALRTGQQPPWMVNNMLRRHFIDLTVQFLAPLDRYFSTLIPIVHSATAIPAAKNRPQAAPWTHAHQRSTSLAEGEGALTSSLAWFAAPGPLRPWRTGDFLASLASLGISPQLSGRAQTATAADVFASVFSGSTSNNTVASSSDSREATPTFQPWKAKKGSVRISDEWQQLYSQFLQCGNFATWLAHRTEEAQRALQVRFSQELSRGDMHAWCRGYDYPLGLAELQLAAEIEQLDLATMDLGQGRASQPHVRHVFYHGEAEDERARAERRRRQMLREQQARLADSERPVYGSDGTLVGYTQRTVPGGEGKSAKSKPKTKQQGSLLINDSIKQARPLQGSPLIGEGMAANDTQHTRGADVQAATRPARRKQLGQRITHARRAQHTMLQAAQQLQELATGTLRSSGRSGGAEQQLPTATVRSGLLRQLSVLLEYMPAEAGRAYRGLVAADYRQE